MNVLGHGIDLVEIARIERMLADHPERFVDRCFDPVESEYADGAEAVRCERLAARFAAKEAVLKALGTGLRSGMEWTDIVVVQDELGAPSIRLGGRVAEVAASKGIEAWQLSLSHAGGFAMASVLALGPAAD